ncbi:MAG: ATP-binding protein [Alloprevotella sp.]|nr:ATP-binding protein [Alloprevotella sp.]
MNTLISRQRYTDLIAPFIDKNIIKVLTGQRRVGKSCILRQLQEQMRTAGANTIYINKEFDEFAAIRTNEDLSAYVAANLRPGVPNYLFVDEVQDIQGFEHTLRSLQAQDACDIFITGSNATMLSSELSSYLAGRYVEFHIHSLTYAEFLQFHRLTPSTQSLRNYLTYGGLPYLSNLPLQRDIVFEYLRNVYSTILLKDIVKREGIRNVDFLESLARYTADNVGNLFSANNISRYLKSQRVNISPLQVINYLRTLQNAYLIHKVRRVDAAGLKTFEIGDKYYFEDLGLRNCHMGFSMQNDISKLIENAIYLHLLHQRFDVFTGQLPGGSEIDFVARRDDAVVYVQATYRMDSEATREREFGNLLAIRNNYPKYVVSLDEWTSGSNVEGIHHVHLADFLQMDL